MVQHSSIWVLELPKYKGAEIHNERERWVRFFNEGRNLQEETLPSWMQTKEMKQAGKLFLREPLEPPSADVPSPVCVSDGVSTGVSSLPAGGLAKSLSGV